MLLGFRSKNNTGPAQTQLEEKLSAITGRRRKEDTPASVASIEQNFGRAPRRDMNNPRRYRYLISYLRRIREAIERVPDAICNCGVHPRGGGEQGE